ncbi:MAG: UvrD-helicase domain-containing protein [Verrucomicrobiota bacterium]|nr:UvrD-helicase domain-containing protein [Verrucomicrobiota bacterium]
MNNPVTFVNEVIPASAGTGKTFQLTDKFINLMNQGVKPENIVALTFTNKASAEFFEGILEKLAKSSKHFDDPMSISDITGVPELSSDKAIKLLRTFINAMPSLEMGTLDSFLYKMINHIPFEMGIAGEFEILTEHEATIAREKVCRKVFDDKVSSDDFLIAFKLASFGKEGSGMLFKLNQFIERAHGKFIYNPEPELWGNKSRIWPDEFQWTVLEEDILKEKINRLSTLIEETEVKEKVATKLKSFLSWIIETKPGNPVPGIHKTIHKNFLEGFKDIKSGNAQINVERNKFEISGELAELFSDVISHMIGLQLETHLMRTRGLWKVLQSYEDEYGGNVRQKGRLTFSDFPYFLSKNNWSTSNMIDVLEYRIDAKYDHWLLDEFQDTSREQWNAIENLIDECAMDSESGRSVFIVGDIKQSIYAWRGGDTKIFKEQREKYRDLGPERFKETHLDESRRSSQPVITTVNSIFGSKDKLHDIFPSIEGRWEYEKHTTVHKDRPGFTSWTCAEKTGRYEKLNAKLELTAEIIRKINPSENKLNIGVLVQKNKTGRQITDYLRQHTGLKVTNDTKIYIAKDNAIGIALLSIFRLSAHPGDEFSWGHVMMSPFRRMIEAEYPSIEKLGSFVRSSVWKDQFTETLRKLVSSLGIQLDQFNTMRVDQLLKAASIFDKRGSRSIDAFVRFMENYTLRETGQPGTVQVMTIHQSKGITFDSVILPELEGNTFSSMNLGTEIKYNATHDPQWILNMPNKRYIEIDPQLNRYNTDKIANDTYEQICKFYVALTRAKYANYLITEESEITSKSDNFVSLLSDTIKSEDLNNGTLYSCGDSEWYEKIAQEEETPPIQKKPLPLPSENLRREKNTQSATEEVSEKLTSEDIFGPSTDL